MKSPFIYNNAVLQNPMYCPERSEVAEGAALEHHQIGPQASLHDPDLIVEPQCLGTRARRRCDHLKRRHSQRLQICQFAVKHDAAKLHVRSGQ